MAERSKRNPFETLRDRFDGPLLRWSVPIIILVTLVVWVLGYFKAESVTAIVALVAVFFSAIQWMNSADTTARSLKIAEDALAASMVPLLILKENAEAPTVEDHGDIFTTELVNVGN